LELRAPRLRQRARRGRLALAPDPQAQAVALGELRARDGPLVLVPAAEFEKVGELLVPVHGARVRPVPVEAGLLQRGHALGRQLAALMKIALAIGPQADAVVAGILLGSLGPSAELRPELEQMPELSLPLLVPTSNFPVGYLQGPVDFDHFHSYGF